MPRVLLFNKPCGVLCQFSPSAGRRTLKDFIPVADVYPAGRLDADSEGLVVLTDDGKLQHAISDPQMKLSKTYWVQVEGEPDEVALRRLRSGVGLGDFVTHPARARRIDRPSGLWERIPPIRVRKSIPTSWIEMELREGKNRQVRRMTAAAGYPTLRLIRSRIGPWTLDSILPGQFRLIDQPQCGFEAVSAGCNKLCQPCITDGVTAPDARWVSITPVKPDHGEY